MGSTQREEIVPAPPPYTPVDGSQRSGQQAANNRQGAYAPPPGPPPQHTNGNRISNNAASTSYAPPPGPPPPLNGAAAAASSSSNGAYNDASLGPPPLSELPPTYEPFSFTNSYNAAADRKGSGNANAPRWHSVPVYDMYHDPTSSTLTFHLARPSTLPPCACANDFVCRCDRRQPAIWQARKASRQKNVQLVRISPCSNTSERALTATKPTLSTSSTLTVRDQRDKKVTELMSWPQGKTFTFIDGQQLTWTRRGPLLELLNQAGIPFAILHTNTTPVRLELTAFVWSRMPSDELECDFDNCALRPLFGFVFRCRDCTEQGMDSFDICEAHLVDECARHDPHHRFERLPRPFGQWDDNVRETPLLRTHDIHSQRQSQELVILTLACALLDKAGK